MVGNAVLIVLQHFNLAIGCQLLDVKLCVRSLHILWGHVVVGSFCCPMPDAAVEKGLKCRGIHKSSRLSFGESSR